MLIAIPAQDTPKAIGVHKGRLSREKLLRRLSWEDLDISYMRQLIALAKEEDLEGSGLAALPGAPVDVTTSAVVGDTFGRGELVSRFSGVICGTPLIPLVLDAYGKGCTVTMRMVDGSGVENGTTIASVAGPAATLLQAERVLLNFLQHLSGVASNTARYVAALGWSQTKLLDTRKTTPGFRVLEKYAVACGGGWNHRMGLFDRVLLKDNHLAVAGATAGERLAAAVRQARERNPALAIEVEVDSLSQIPPVLEAEADIILLDNFDEADLAEAVSLIGERAYTEASGGVSLETLPSLAEIGLDFISCGALIHQSTWCDIGLDWSL